MVDSRIDELRRRLERDPGSRLFAQLAEEYRKAGDQGEAIRVARAGLAHHPGYASARLTLGRALLDSGEAGTARVELEAALREAPDNILASRFLGQALEALGELGPALLQLEKTLKLAPGDRQLEAQVVALRARLAGGTGGGATPPASSPPRPSPPPLPPSAAAPVARPSTVPAAAVPGGPPPPPAPRAEPPPLRSRPTAERVPAVTAPGAGPRGGPSGVGGEAAAPLPTSTLAELYVKQGLLAEAAEVYRQVVASEPANGRARQRLREIEASVTAPDPRQARRVALQRTIAGLEALLAAVRGR